MDKDQDGDFFELPDEIPYKKVSSFSVQYVETEGDAFAIQIYKKCQGIPQEKDGHRLLRTHTDLMWLMEKMMKETPYLVVIPLALQKTYWESLKDFTGSLKNDHKTITRREYSKKFMCQNVQRFLNIISKISIKFLYRVGHTQSSLFTFLDQKFKMYQMEVYQKKEEGSAHTISNTVTTKTQKFFKYVSEWMGSRQDKLAPQKDKLNELKAKVSSFSIAASKYEESLANLGVNFLSHQSQIQKKCQKVFLLLLRVGNIEKLISNILLEINFIVDRAEEVSKIEQEKQVTTQLAAYGQFVSLEIAKLEKNINALIQEFLKVAVSQNVQISMMEMAKRN